MKNKRILITGGTGFIGTHLTNLLVERGYEPVVIGYGIPEGFPESVQVLEVDIADDEAMSRLSEEIGELHALIHLAACLHMNSPETIRVNCQGTRAVMALANKCHVKELIYLSSIPVIGHPMEIPVTEEHPADPPTLYHITKLAGEYMVRTLAAGDMHCCTLRIASPVGKGMSQKTFLSMLLASMKAGKEVELYGEGRRVQNYIDVRDISEGILTALEKHAEGLYLLAGKESVSNRGLAEKCLKLTGSSSDIISGRHPDREENDRWEISGAKMKKDLGFEAAFSLDETINWILS